MTPPGLGGFSANRTRNLALLVLAVVFLAINRDLILGRAAIPWDADEFFAPYYTLLADFSRSGRLLLWNPWTNGGMPDFVEPQTGATSPVHILFSALTGGTSTGFRLFHLSIWLFSGLGLFLLGCRLRAPVWGSFVVALAFAFSGFQMGHSEHVSFLYSFAWMPLQLVFFDRALEKRSWISAAQAGVAWGLSFLGGYPPITLNNGAFCGLWALGRWLFPFPSCQAVSSTPTSRRAVPMVGLLAIFGIVGIAVMTPVLIGMQVEAAGVSSRVAALSRARVIGENFLGPLALTSVFSPYFSRLPPTALWPATDASSCGVYAGGIVLTLALWALLGRPGRAARWALLAVAVGAAALAVGQTLPFRGWLYDYVPPTRFFRHPAIYRAYIILSLTILALLGTRDLAEMPRRRWPLLASALAAAAGTAWAFTKISSLASDDHLASGEVHAVVLWLGIIVVAALFTFVKSRRSTVLLIGGFLALAVWDAVGVERLSSTHVTRDPGTLALWRKLDAEHQPSLAMTDGLARAAVADPTVFGPGLTDRNLPAKKPTLLGYVALKNSFHEQWSHDPLLMAAASGSDRIWFAAEATQAEPVEELFGAFVKRARELNAIPLVVHEPAAMVHPTGPSVTGAVAVASLAKASPARRIPSRLVSYEPNALILDVDAPGDGWLFVTDRWAPGWKAWVNGHAVPVFGGNFIFRAIRVTSGGNHVVMRYQPKTVPWLILLSWGTLGSVLLAGLAQRHPRRARDLLARLRRRLRQR